MFYVIPYGTIPGSWYAWQLYWRLWAETVWYVLERVMLMLIDHLALMPLSSHNGIGIHCVNKPLSTS